MRAPLLLCLAGAASAASVVESDGSDFADLLSKHSHVLAKFSVPWCMHCHKVNGDWKEACDALDKDYVCVNLNADEKTSDVAKRYGVKTYPVIKAFTADTGSGFEHRAEIKAANVVEWAQGLLGPALPVLEDKDELTDFSSSLRVAVVGFFKKATREAQEFEALAAAHRDRFRFGVVHDQALAAAELIDMPGVVVYKQFDDPRVVMPGKYDSSKVLDFARAHGYPLFEEITPANYQTYLDRELPIVWVFVNPEDAEGTEAAKAVGRAVAEQAPHVGALSFGWTNGPKFVRLARKLALSGETWPALAVDVLQKEHYAYDESSELDVAKVEAWLGEYKSGALAQSVRSQPAPEVKTVNGLTTVVGSTFTQTVLNEMEDVFVQFHAPWCGHCLQMKNDVEQLAKHFRDETSIRIVKFDATTNDWPVGDFPVVGYPTLFFVRAGSNEIVKYDDVPEFAEIKAYIEAEAQTDRYRAAKAAAAAAAAAETEATDEVAEEVSGEEEL